jgi:hypothetical protein
LARWDDPLNRSINVVLSNDPLMKPAHGRVNGAGFESKWVVHYFADRDVARQRRKVNKATLEQKIMKMKEEAVAQAKAEARAEVELLVQNQVQAQAQAKPCCLH